MFAIIGLLNICLGFGLAMYCGYGPPNLRGILESLGSLPPVLESPPGHLVEHEQAAISGSESTVDSIPMVPASGDVVPSSEMLAEEQLLGDVRDLAGTLESAVISGQPESGG